jgi:cobalt-zinc-cadmium efflux system membrane fusion protein
MVHCHFEKEPRNLLPGMFLNAVFELDNQLVTAVPEDAIVRYMGKEYVFIAKNETTFHLSEVTSGVRQNGMAALSGGNVHPGEEQIVTRGAFALLGKMKNKMED